LNLRVTLSPSPTLATAIVIAHGVAIAAAFVGLPVSAAAIVAAGLGLSAVHYLRLALHRSPLAVAGLEFTAHGGIAVAGPAGDWSSATLRSAAAPVPWLVAVTMRDAFGRKRAVCVLPDGADANALRRMRVRLAWFPYHSARDGQENDSARR
jgi:hypothetical protein